jgi:hypothetical protein
MIYCMHGCNLHFVILFVAMLNRTSLTLIKYFLHSFKEKDLVNPSVMGRRNNI